MYRSFLHSSRPAWLARCWAILLVSIAIIPAAGAAKNLNKLGRSPEAVLDPLDPFRMPAGVEPLDHIVLNSQALIRKAIPTDWRPEPAFEG